MSMLDGLKELISNLEVEELISDLEVGELISGPEVAKYLIEICEDIVSLAIAYIIKMYI